jgi:hypothetical protein
MTTRVAGRVAILLMSLMLADAAGAQPTAPPDRDVDGVAGEISRAIAAGDLDGAAGKIAETLREGADKVRPGLQSIAPLGKSQYVDRVYARAYGKTSKDLIDKIMYEQNVLYVRYLFSVDQGGWRLIRFDMNTELTAPFPKDWAHIYP